MRNFIIVVFAFIVIVSDNSWADSTPVSPAAVIHASVERDPVKAASVKPTAEKSAVEKTRPAKQSLVSSHPSEKQSVTFKSLAQMNELTALGVPALALSLLEREQKSREQFTADWYAFEYKRINLLAVLERWQPLIERTQWLFDTALPEKQITQKIRLWFETQQVMAKLHLKQSAQALAQLQRLLWQSRAEDRDPSLPSVWRQLVIRTYLQMQNDDDARRALVKYEHDYKDSETDSDWLLLQAKVLMKTDRPQQALQILKQVDSDEALALILLAELQNKPANAKQIKQQLNQHLNGKVISRSARWAYTYVAFQVAKVLSDLALQIQHAETMLSLGIDYPVLDESYQVTADDLWDLYNQRGLAIANENGLLFGFDDQWLTLSQQMHAKAPEKSVALNAALVLHEKVFSSKQQPHKTIVEVLETYKQGLELINQLYLHSEKVSDVSVLPEEVRYRLVDYALSAGEYADASIIMQSLTQPPQGKSDFDWRMRKARVLILQGEHEQSEKLIRQTMAGKTKITPAELDRYIQVVFDFQTVQQHQQAINLFELISFENLAEKLKREIYFWKAESFFALKQYDLAALNYLSSARAVTGEGNDLWGQSARFKAAESLVLAEIFDDAKKIYSELLLVTDSGSRKALINQNLQKIRLLKSAGEKNSF